MQEVVRHLMRGAPVGILGSTLLEGEFRTRESWRTKDFKRSWVPLAVASSPHGRKGFRLATRPLQGVAVLEISYWVPSRGILEAL